MMSITAAAAAAAAGGRVVLPKRALFLSPRLMLLGVVAALSFSCAIGREKEVLTPGYYADNIGGVAEDYPRGFIRGKRDDRVGAPAPLALMPERDTTTGLTPPMNAQRRLQELGLAQDVPRHLLVTGSSGDGDSQVETIWRMEEDGPVITQATLKKIEVVIVLQDEGIVYCPIPKVSSSEWKRSLRWMMGNEHWDDRDGTLHNGKTNGLPLLAKRGLQDTRWALESDRFLRFVVVRDPAERLVSSFLNKCVNDGYESAKIVMYGAPHCLYLKIMPELFPSIERAGPSSHARFKELVETDPEGTFYHFARGIWREVQSHGDACKMPDVHHRPQTCFCDLPNLLPAFHVIPFSNLSVEAEAFAGRLPVSLPKPDVGVQLETMGFRGAEGVTAEGRRTGVDEERREEIHGFLKDRFSVYHEVEKQGNQAHERKHTFLSEPVMELIHNMYKNDYDLLGEYF